MAIEISPDPAKRSEQLMANENLIKEANGAMAPMTGSERSLVAMTAFSVCAFLSACVAATIGWHPMLPLLPYVHVHAGVSSACPPATPQLF